MSPELETLDQLLGGEMPASVCRQLYPNDASFRRGIGGLLAIGDIRLLRGTQELPEWEWRELLRSGTAEQFDLVCIDITDQGAKRIS